MILIALLDPEIDNLCKTRFIQSKNINYAISHILVQMKMLMTQGIHLCLWILKN